MTSTSSLIDDLITILKKYKSSHQLYGWKIVEKRKKKVQRYYIHEVQETELQAERREYSLTVYVRKKNKMGEASVTILDIQTAGKKIDEALLFAGLSLAQAWNLPKPSAYPIMRTADPAIVRGFTLGTIDQELDRLEQQMCATSRKEKKVILNSAELSISYSQLRILTSTGIDVSQEITRVFMDIALTCKQKVAGVEIELDYTPQFSTCRLDQFSMPAFVAQSCSFVKDAVRGKKPESFEGRILLSHESLLDLFVPVVAQASPYIMHTLGRLNHLGLISHTLGDLIAPHELTITTDPFIDYGYSSANSDMDGCSAKRTTLIKNGKLTSFLCSSKYAQYLHKPLSTPLSNIVVTPGTIGQEDLRSGEYIEIVKFSSFIPDWLTGNFSAEVRLGYHGKDGVRTPFRGGLLVGNVFKNSLQLSKEIMDSNGYIGPAVIGLNARLNTN